VNPSLFRVMRRPKSLVMLVAFLALAVVFALFGQWQLSRAVQAGTVLERPTEQVLALSDVAQPASSVSDAAISQLVTTTGEWVPDEFSILQDRLDRGRSGYWLTGHFRTDEGASLGVALGWTSDRTTAESTLADMSSIELPTTVSGRFQQSEGPTIPADGQPYAKDLSVAALINEWADPGPTYSGYVTLTEAPAATKLTSIDSPSVEQEVQLNFLNLFYALEWTLFALVALYIWYRLVRDRYEQELDETLAGEAAAEDSAAERAAEQSAPRP